jgi:hypothetical protein
MLRGYEDSHEEDLVLDNNISINGNNFEDITKRRKLSSCSMQNMGKDLTPEQKSIVKMHVIRESTEGAVKCAYCDKEITSKNVDRWASHLRGCLKTPEGVKTQIQPFRGGAAMTLGIGAPANSSQGVLPGATTAATSVLVGAGNPNPINAVPTAHLGSLSTSLGPGHSEIFKVHVSKDYMKFNAAHFIAYKGFREKLHGHNYRVGVTITGVVGHDGYVVDFGEIKKVNNATEVFTHYFSLHHISFHIIIDLSSHL